MPQDVTVELDGYSFRELSRVVQRLAQVAGKTALETMVSQARLFCTDLVFCTRPLGGKGKDVKAEHEKKISARVNECYWTIGKAVEEMRAAGELGKSRAFQRFIRQKNFNAAAGVANEALKMPYRFEVGPFDGGTIHKAERFKKNVRQVLICTEKAAITRYMKQEIKQSGFAKAGYATAARDLGGTRGIPGFVTRHRNAPGKGRAMQSGDDLTVEIENSVPYAEKALDYGWMNTALDVRKSKIEKLIRRILDNRAKQISPSLK